MNNLTASLSCCDKASGKKIVPRILGQIVCLTCKEGFIHLNTSLKHSGIRWDLIPGFQKQNVIQNKLICRNTPLLSFPQHHCFTLSKDCQLVQGLLCADLLSDTYHCIDNDDPDKHGILI